MSRRLRLMLFSLLVFLAMVTGINWLANPYGAWRVSVIDEVYRSTELHTRNPGKREAGQRITIAYRLRIEEPTTLLVGSSRVVLGMPVAQGYRDGWLNAGIYGASLAEITDLLRLAMANPRLKRVIWGLDFHAFDENFRGFRYPETQIRLEADGATLALLRIKDTLLSLQALDDSRRVLLSALAGRKNLPPSISVPWPEAAIRESLEQSAQDGLGRADEEKLKQQLTDWVVSYTHYQFSPALFSLFEQTVARLRNAGIEVVLFVTPLSTCELEIIRQTGRWETFQQWKRQLLAAEPYWDFSGHNELEEAMTFFQDAHHFKPAVGHAILRQLLGADCAHCGDLAKSIRDSGVWVDARTLEPHLARQEAKKLVRAGSRCAKVVENLRASIH